MSLSIGIVGLPNVGKSTLFSALTKKQVEIANYPFATIDPNVGIVEVPDERLQKLAVLSQSEKVIPTVIEFLDIAGLVKGANKGEGLGNQFLNHIRDVDAILYVVRVFEDTIITHVENSVDPLRDIETVRAELALKDIEAVERRLDKVRGEARSGSKEAKAELVILENFFKSLNSGIHIYETIKGKDMDTATAKILKEMQMLTAKPALYLLNSNIDEVSEGLIEFIYKKGGRYVVMNAKEELDGAELTNKERAELGLVESKLPALIREAYELLQLITFFTTGRDETRAWTVRQGAKAPEAAGRIHTDFKEKFIRAEVIQWDKLLGVDSWGRAREAGLIRTEGKDYTVNDGDVMVILHSA